VGTNCHDGFVPPGFGRAGLFFGEKNMTMHLPEGLWSEDEEPSDEVIDVIAKAVLSNGSPGQYMPPAFAILSAADNAASSVAQLLDLLTSLQGAEEAAIAEIVDPAEEEHKENIATVVRKTVARVRELEQAAASVNWQTKETGRCSSARPNIEPQPLVIEVCERLQHPRRVLRRKEGSQRIESVELPTFHAAFKGDLANWDAGKTREEAIGNLVTSHPERFGIAIEHLEVRSR